MTPVLYHEGGFPPKSLDWSRLLPLIGPANAAVARYEGILRGVPNPNVLLSPLTAQEAVLSSRIEGTQTTLGEVLEFEAEGNPADETTSRKADIHEVLNYRIALSEATRMMEKLPLSQRLVKRTHAVLMRGVRGRNKAPGQYRGVPNWIGPEGCSIEEARFVPCNAEHVSDAMNAWEHYLHASAPDILVQLAVVHAEFESIHPFLDGNGRLGRLIVPLFLHAKKLLSLPNFYISEYLNNHRDEYYERLLAVSGNGDWSAWCEFFLKAVISQAEMNQQKAQAILSLYDERKNWIAEITHSQYAMRALDWFFARPIFRASDFVANAEIPRPTANRILRVVRDGGLLREIRPASGRRAAVVAFTDLLNIAEGKRVF